MLVHRFYSLPSLTALAAFEASARHSSMTRAADELNVTPGAVSRQIRAIEDDLGVSLFLRKGRGVALTPAGEELYGTLAASFARLSDVVGTIRRGDRSRNVTLACSDVFATQWLVPRMPDFWRRFPEIVVDHLISDNTRNFRLTEVELRVRFGLGTWMDETAELLFDEELYPVCSPAFAARHEGATTADLARLPLLNVDWADSDWIGWEEALLRGGVPFRAFSGRRFGKFSVALQAAMADQGLVLGWHRVVRPLIETGELVRFGDLVIPAPGAYHLTWNSHRDLSPAALVLRDWIRSLAAEERRAPCPSE